MFSVPSVPFRIRCCLLPHPPNHSYRPPNRSYRCRTVPTAAERFLPPPNHSYHPPNRSYRCRTVPTAAESFLPPPNGSYRRRIVPTVAESFLPSAEWFLPTAEPFSPGVYGVSQREIIGAEPLSHHFWGSRLSPRQSYDTLKVH